MGLLDGSAEEPRSKTLRYFMTGMIFALLLAVGVWYVFRFHTEVKTVERFLDALVAGELPRAYEIWQPTPRYTFKDFVEDWGPEGYYGPVKSYQIQAAERPDGASGVIVVIAVSPFQTFPTSRETDKHARIREIRLWVERRDQSLSYAPELPRRRSLFGRR